MHSTKLSSYSNSSDDSDLDTLRSDSTFLPVYSPLKNSLGDHQKELESYLMGDYSKNAKNASYCGTNVENEFPMLTEEEASKLINLAATILQAQIRGFLVRRRFNFIEYKRLNVAAMKIQAAWRGYYFRKYSARGLSLRNEIRVKRLQKYICTLCMVIQKKNTEHENETSRLLEIISLLCCKLEKVTEKVDKFDIVNDEECKPKMKCKDSDVDPVFYPHPRFSKMSELNKNTNDISGQSFTHNSEIALTKRMKMDGLRLDSTSRKCGKNSSDDKLDVFDAAKTGFHGNNVDNSKNHKAEEIGTIVDKSWIKFDNTGPAKDMSEIYESSFDVHENDTSTMVVDVVKHDNIDESHVLIEGDNVDMDAGSPDEGNTLEDNGDCFEDTKTFQDSSDHLNSQSSSGIAAFTEDNDGSSMIESKEFDATVDVCDLLKTIDTDRKLPKDETVIPDANEESLESMKNSEGSSIEQTLNKEMNEENAERNDGSHVGDVSMVKEVSDNVIDVVSLSNITDIDKMSRKNGDVDVPISIVEDQLKDGDSNAEFVSMQTEDMEGCFEGI
ncbi:uncharacterized protein LOC124440955 [Xenia sp. Carnegie-2017]|uniref:uncharacterized protein LOC124440955 n=1 Tax=Xenia sp. Carnegie-2017 TaxID=2897299 RepID=UPI001F04DE40|nr:uncharacterized protein LOC124440955 [Xenia sp. Carnegie-2017]